MKVCEICHTEKARVKRSETGQLVCSKCFTHSFEEEVFETIQRFHLIVPGDVVAIGVSGGKDSTVLLHVLDTLNKTHNMGFSIQLISIDEGIAGYRDASLNIVTQNAQIYNLPLIIIPFKELFGWSLDQIFQATQTKETCTYCGIFRRRALDIGAARVHATKVAVGHNEDDIAETVLLNMLRGDNTRFTRSVDIMTNGIEAKMSESRVAPRIKPLAFQSQVDIVKYAHVLNLKYFPVECTYAVQAFRRFPRDYLVNKQQSDPGVMRRIINGAINYQDEIQGTIATSPSPTDPGIKFCRICHAPCNHDICMACNLLERLKNGYAQREVVEDPPAP